MQRYLNSAVHELSAQLCVGLLRLRKGYVDAAESLLQIIDPAKSYPLDFVTYRLTGFRGRRDQPTQTLQGAPLRRDLQQLVMDVSASFDLFADQYKHPCYDTPALAARYNVSTKTVQRWRRQGLPARMMVFGDRGRRIGFLDSSVQWFVRDRQDRVARAMRFCQLSLHERRDILRRARRMAGFTECTMSEVVRRLAVRTGRSPETIRYVVRRHDQDNPQTAIFPLLRRPLAREQKEIIYSCFLRGVRVSALAGNYQRTRGSIYRIVNEQRARRLLAQPISCIYNPQFDLPGADELVLGLAAPQPAAPVRPAPAARPQGAGLPPYLEALYDVPLLSPQRERDLFCRYNYLKHKADKLRRQIDLNRIRTSLLRQIESLLLQASGIKNDLVRANLRLVVSIARKHVARGQELLDLVSDGNVILMRAVETFDFARKVRFSTYASWAIMRQFARELPARRYRLDRQQAVQETLQNIARSAATDAPELAVKEIRESLGAVMAQLTPRERAILTQHYGLGDQDSASLEQLGRRMGLSKERIRQIEAVAMAKLRKILHPKQAELMQ